MLKHTPQTFYLLFLFLLWAPVQELCLKIERQKPVSEQLNCSDICHPPADCILVLWFYNVLLLWCFSGGLLCVMLWFRVSERRSQNYKGFYLFISPPSLSIHPFFRAVALFPKLTNILELIEYDPLTAVWNNEASLSLHFLPEDGLSLLHSGPHQSALSVWNLGLKELLITLRAQASIFTASAPTKRGYYGAKSPAFRVRRQ